jgi:hypothetical protein
MIEEKMQESARKCVKNARKLRKKGIGREERKHIWRSRAPQESCSDTITRK